MTREIGKKGEGRIRKREGGREEGRVAGGSDNHPVLDLWWGILQSPGGGGEG